MRSNPAKIVGSWLSALHIPVSTALLYEQLTSHPEYPSLLSITDTLTDLGVDNSAYMVEKDRLEEIPLPFLAYLPEQDGEFVLVQNVEKLLKKNPDFYSLWEGVAVVAEKTGRALNKVSERAHIEEVKSRNLIITVISGVVLLSLLSLVNNFSLAKLLFMLASLTGAGIAILIMQQELGYANSLTDKLCGVSKKTDCKAILNSKGSNLLKGLNWADMGIIYFFAQWLLVTIALFAHLNAVFTSFLPALSAAAVLFTLYSIYYQWKMEKWCILCLIIVTILWIQFFLLLLTLLKIGSVRVATSQVIFAAFVISLVSGGWLAFLRPILRNLQNAKNKAISFTQFKKSAALFMAVLENQRSIDTTPFENDLQLANPLAPLQLMFACNPYCEPCAKAHKVLHDSIEKYGDRIGVTVRFMLTENSEGDVKTKAVEYLLKQVLLLPVDMPEYQKKACNSQLMEDWFKHMDMEEFMEKHPLVAEIDASNLLRMNALWTMQNNIEFTPTIFINGFPLPKPFSPADLPEILFGLLTRPDKE